MLANVCLCVRRTHELEFATADVGDVHVVGRRRQIFQLLAGEDVDGNQMNLGVTVLASLGGGHVNDLARAAFDDDVTVLPQGRALHGEGGRGASIGGIEGMLMLLIQSSAVELDFEMARACSGAHTVSVSRLTCASLGFSVDMMKGA